MESANRTRHAGSPAARYGFLYALLIAGVGVGALALRLPQLDIRPMHADEAVQAYKTGKLLETGEYRYDPNEFHGPTLYYLTLPVAWLSGARTFAQTTEWTYRIVPVMFGVALVLLLWMVGDGLGRPAAVWAAALTALSPAMVFYSRYYIQEMLLVFFTFLVIAAGWRYSRTRHAAWALLMGLGLGLMHATKETCAINWGAMAAALLLTGLASPGAESTVTSPRSHGRSAAILPPQWCVRVCDAASAFRINPRDLIIAILAACIISVAFFSSFFSNAQGPLNSVLAFGSYLSRSDGARLHDHPWDYYLKLLLYTKRGPGPFWSEGLIIALAAMGAIATLVPRGLHRAHTGLPRFLSFYTICLTVIYCLIPYKTPWCMLGFLHGMILMAGIGAASLIKWMRGPLPKALVGIALVAGLWQLGLEAYRASYYYCADIRNPYVYAQTSTDLLRLAERAEDLAKLDPEGQDMPIQVIKPNGDYWPLPWYLRRFTHVGYWKTEPERLDAPVIITSPDAQKTVEERLEGAYQPDVFGLRPGVFLVAYIRADLWERFINTRTGGPPSRNAEEHE